MKRYIALLRGINVGGKNKIIMSKLKMEIEKLGFSNVATYLNSGNIIFSSPIDDENKCSILINAMIKEKFDLKISVHTILQANLKEALNNAPEWWGSDNKDIYDNLIFMLPSLTFEKLYDEIGNPNQKYEKIHHCNNVIFWSFIRKDYQKTKWWSKTASTKSKELITIRTANTVRKIVTM
ncbi:MAG: DUF1697 domain-containing protein [Streptococcaceae bacterium]|jgi:uncharacterized protein (DUF1697 family)|nr:DUF1697 domain-containing protein [Streptococcaceae bacterium]MCH4178132.1 DUF1697 domain-containing protein [Streptococcaceae bacterium]